MASETTTLPPKPKGRIRFDLLFPVIVRPKQAFERITSAQPRPWITPLLVLSMLAIAAIVVSGPARIQAIQEAFVLPPELQDAPPEMQENFDRAFDLSTNPIRVYVLPVVGGVIGVWFGWLILSGLLHLMLTLFGGRSGMGGTMNITAWALLPFGIRNLVQSIYMLITGELIQAQGLGGFAPVTDAPTSAAAMACLSVIDIYLFWHIALLLIGVGARSEGNSANTSRLAVGAVMLIVLGFRTLVGFGLAQASTLIGPG